MDEFELELKKGFLEEATQMLSDVEQCFLELESDPTNSGILEKIFRLAHNIKGSSKAVGFSELGAFTHEFESFLLKIKNGEYKIDTQSMGILFKCNDQIKTFVELLQGDLAATLPCDDLISVLKNYSPNATPEATPEPVVDAPLAETIAATAPEPEPIIETAPAPTPAVVAPTEVHAHELESLTKSELKKAPTPVADESIRVSLKRVETLVNFVGELVILQTVLREQSLQSFQDGSSAVAATLLRKTVLQINKVTKEIQDLAMSLRMVPLKQTFQKMQRIVRDTGTMLGKKVNLQITGEDTEVDKTVLENLGDPLVHIIRNAVDHGIEPPESRTANGKDPAGNVKLSAFHQGGKLVIEIRDDGAGINGQRLKEKAIEKGILKPNQMISEKDAVNLIFHPGFSTKEKVTEVSGRGVGMDVVKTNIQALQGEVEIDTVVGKGSCFRIFLPLTLAIIEGMVIRSKNDRVVVPLSHIHETVRPKTSDIHRSTTSGDMLKLRGETIPIFRLQHLLTNKTDNSERTEEIALIIRTEAQPFAIFVDDIIGQQQVVIKKLGQEIQHIKGFTGSAILGDGKPALIIELGELIKRKAVQLPVQNLNSAQNQTRRLAA